MILKHIHFFKSSYSILQCDPLSKTSTSTYSLPNLMDHPIRSPIACYSRDKRTMEKLSKQMQRVRSTSSFVQREADGLTMEAGWEERAAAAAASRSQERETRPRSRCCRRRRRRPSRDLHAARRPLSRWLLLFSPALCSFSFQSPAPFLCVHRTVGTYTKAGSLATSADRRIQELGFALARHYVVYEHGNVARQRRKSVHGRTGQYLPVKRHSTKPAFQDFSNRTSFIRPADPLCFRSTTNRHAALAGYQ